MFNVSHFILGILNFYFAKIDTELLSLVKRLAAVFVHWQWWAEQVIVTGEREEERSEAESITLEEKDTLLSCVNFE